MYGLIVKIRSGLLVYLTHNMALPLLKLVRRNEVFPYSIGNLHTFATGTLGKELACFLERSGLKLLPYYARHDIKHILLDYETTDEGEGSLQCFMLGNGHLSFPVVATVVYCFATMPEYWHLFRKAYMRGKRSVQIGKWRWFELLETPVISLKQQINSQH